MIRRRIFLSILSEERTIPMSQYLSELGAALADTCQTCFYQTHTTSCRDNHKTGLCVCVLSVVGYPMLSSSYAGHTLDSCHNTLCVVTMSVCFYQQAVLVSTNTLRVFYIECLCVFSVHQTKYRTDTQL